MAILPHLGSLLGAGGGAGGGAGAALGLLSKASGPVGMGLSLLPQLAKFITSRSQKRKADAINPVNPGFVMNSGVIDNNRILNNNYANFSLPGKTGITNAIDSNIAGSMGAVRDASTSSADAIDAITKLSMGKNDTMLNLGIQEAGMKQQMLGEVLNSNAAVGDEYVKRNEYDNAVYQQELAEKAALNEASAQNGFSALDGTAALGGSLLNYKAQQFSPNVGRIDPLGNMFKKK